MGEDAGGWLAIGPGCVPAVAVAHWLRTRCVGAHVRPMLGISLQLSPLPQGQDGPFTGRGTGSDWDERPDLLRR